MMYEVCRVEPAGEGLDQAEKSTAFTHDPRGPG